MAFSLGTERMAEIKGSVERGEYFGCHKTTQHRLDLEQEHGSWDHVPFGDKLDAVAKEQQCAGAIKWAATREGLVDGD